MDPYEARKIYVKLADKILKGIPGPHLATMDTWPKWSAKKFPPVPGGLYPNPKYRPEPLLPPTNGEDPVHVSLSHGPTLLSQRISGLPGEAKTIAPSDTKVPMILGPNKGTTETTNVFPKVDPGAERVRLDTLNEYIKLGADVPKISQFHVPGDAISTSSEDVSVDLSVAMAEFEGTPATIGGSGSSFQTPVELVKHLAITGGDSYSHKSDNRYWSRCWFFAWSWCRCAQKVAIMVIQQATEGRANQRNI